MPFAQSVIFTVGRPFIEEQFFMLKQCVKIGDRVFQKGPKFIMAPSGDLRRSRVNQPLQ
jgi:hypothetical protein